MQKHVYRVERMRRKCNNGGWNYMGLGVMQGIIKVVFDYEENNNKWDLFRQFILGKIVLEI